MVIGFTRRCVSFRNIFHFIKVPIQIYGYTFLTVKNIVFISLFFLFFVFLLMFYLVDFNLHSILSGFKNKKMNEIQILFQESEPYSTYKNVLQQKCFTAKMYEKIEMLFIL